MDNRLHKSRNGMYCWMKP